MFFLYIVYILNKTIRVFRYFRFQIISEFENWTNRFESVSKYRIFDIHSILVWSVHQMKPIKFS